MSRIAVIVVAGGQGTRMGTEVPKQFLLLDGVPVLFHTLRAFAAALEDRARQILVLPEAHRALWNSLCRQYRLEVPHEVCAGGENRFESVRNGLEQIGDAEWVAVHDGVRPLVSREVILRTVEGSIAPVSCLDDAVNQCEHCKECVTLELWEQVDRAIANVVDHVTLADLVDKQRRMERRCRDQGAPAASRLHE